jgi:hypothetical protein
VQRVDQRMTELFEQHEKGMPQKDLLSWQEKKKDNGLKFKKKKKSQR